MVCTQPIVPPKTGGKSWVAASLLPIPSLLLIASKRAQWNVVSAHFIFVEFSQLSGYCGYWKADVFVSQKCILPPTKSREGSAFSCVCLFTGDPMWLLFMMNWIGPHQTGTPLDMFKLFQIRPHFAWDPSSPHPTLCVLKLHLMNLDPKEVTDFNSLISPLKTKQQCSASCTAIVSAEFVSCFHYYYFPCILLKWLT